MRRDGIRSACAPLAGLTLLFAAACSGAAVQADRYFASGDYARAAPAYEAAAGAEGQQPLSAKALYQLGVARATPGTPAFDPVKAMAAFDALASRYPDSGYTSRSALPRALLKNLIASESELADRRRDLDSAKADLAALTKTSKAENQDLKRELEDRRTQIAELKGRVAELEQSLGRLKAQLDQIKRIDLGSPSR
jgi:TolA-binding protein